MLYKDKIDQEIYNILPDKEHHYYLVEFNNNDRYDIALWDMNTRKLTYYRKDNDTYIKIDG